MKRNLVIAVPVVIVVAVLIATVAGCGGSSLCSECLPAERHDIAAAELQAMIDDGQPLVLVDVRTASEFAPGHIAGSVNLPLSDIETWAKTLDKRTRTCCICGSGSRSRTAADFLVAEGFYHVSNLLGGMNAWTGDVEAGCGCGF